MGLRGRNPVPIHRSVDTYYLDNIQRVMNFDISRCAGNQIAVFEPFPFKLLHNHFHLVDGIADTGVLTSCKLI